MTAQSKPLRIKSLTLTDFRAFPGPAPAHFDLDGKNLLVYGENGAGKSSIFHALAGFFSHKPARRLDEYRNVFSKAPLDCVSVTVAFNDGGSDASWHLKPATGPLGLLAQQQSVHLPLIENHPASPLIRRSDPRVSQAALRRACLDYRALLDTNYKQGDADINLFDIAVNHLIHDFPVPVAGGLSKTVGELWQTILQAKPSKHGPRLLARVNEACAEFNTGFKRALADLQPFIGILLSELIGADVTVAPFEFGGITYNQARLKRDRDFDGKTLKLVVSFRTHTLTQPQHFLNEGRLSALALSIYLGGRLACTPSAPGQTLKLLMLDDVLIGLDHSNRLPVLDVLRTHFADWQTVLLTHDHVWFEMARFHLVTTNQWKCVEIYEGADVARGIPAPTVRPVGSKAAKACLEQARSFLKDHYIPAAANYTRTAFELALKSFCERFGVPVVFKTDPRHLDTDKLLSAVEAWLKSHAAKGCLSGVIERVKLFRKVVLNPYSHAAPPNIARAEVEGAIAAVEELLVVLEVGGTDGDPLQAAQAMIAKMPPSTVEMHAALGFLRAAFISSLRKFCDRKHIALPYSHSDPGIKALWDKAKADPNNPIPAAFVANVEPAHFGLLIDEVNDAVLLALSAATIHDALNAIADPNQVDRVELDTF
jgi:energy-coupling factor transporter ATP-binding protein EcfA2